MNQPDRSEIEIENLAEKIAFSAREMSAEIDRDRRLPDELVALLREAGLLRAGMPREVQAPELAPGLALRCAEAVARGNASAGWCVSIAITSSLLVGYLPESSREEMFGDGRGVAAGVWAPRGTARSVDGGVVVSGRWPFCSGINHADTLFAGCFIDEPASAFRRCVAQTRPAGPRHLAHARLARHRQPRHRCRRGLRARRSRALSL